ncbi:MAG: MBL fold metallo-hydrolase [Planctomycetes bacterium]|nr:MBL fold metallo-hydrolase [Planctomycetota bacterium]
MTLRVQPLRSGSSGNSLLLRSETTTIVIDAGYTEVEMADTFDRVGVPLPSVHALVVTHAHTDHLGLAARMSRLGKFPVYTSRETVRGAPVVGRLKRLHAFDPGAVLEIGDLQVHTFPISHDAPGTIACVVEGGGGRFGIATDLGHADRALEEALANCNGFLLEFNHDERALRDGAYPWRLKRRVLGEEGHLSNEQAAAMLARCLGPRLRRIYLGHLSEKNNTPAQALAAARRVVERAGRTDITVCIAPRGELAEEFVISASEESVPSTP